MIRSLSFTALMGAIAFLVQAPAVAQLVRPSPELSTLSVRSFDEASNLGAEAYTLGAGDRIQVNVFNAAELSGEFQVAVDGTVNLPWLGIISVRGMSIAEATDLLKQQYSKFLTRSPVVTINLLAPRPVRIAVSGEVERPGTYTTQLSSSGVGGVQWPTLTQLLQTAGGITPTADIRQIQVRRPRRSGADQVISVNLWELLDAGDIAQDLSLRDGDTILVPTANVQSSRNLLRLGNANFSPETINVQVVGEVKRPGSITLPSNPSLNQAILAAGGFDDRRARTSSVELIRLNADGTVLRRRVQIDLAASPNEQSNPLLRPNDVVLVNRSSLATVTDGLGTVLNPLSGFLGVLRLFGISF
jgi:polysaccharide export outer membrane protein